LPERAHQLLDLAHVEAAGDDFVGEPRGIVMAESESGFEEKFSTITKQKRR